MHMSLFLQHMLQICTFTFLAISVNDAARELRGRLFNEKQPEIDRAENKREQRLS